jgi:hypothetical protein
VPPPAPGEAKRAILETYTKEHSTEYQAQAPAIRADRGDHGHSGGEVTHSVPQLGGADFSPPCRLISARHG